MLQGTKEYVAAVDMERARWAQQEALALQALAARPKRAGSRLLYDILAYLGRVVDIRSHLPLRRTVEETAAASKVVSAMK